MKDKRQQMILLQRKKGELAKALRENLATFRKMGIKAEIIAPEGRDNIAFLVLEFNDIATFFQRRLRSSIRKVSRDIEAICYFDGEVLATKIVGKPETTEEEINRAVSKTKSELRKIGIESEIIVKREDKVSTFVIIDSNSVVNYFDKICKKTIKRKAIKVEIVCYREKDTIAVRIRK